MWTIEPSPLGRIAVPPHVPSGRAVFCTTSDFPGLLKRGIAEQVTAVVGQLSGAETDLTSCSQVHGTTVSRAVRQEGWRECDACDALWSSDRGVSLAIKIADCLPVSIIDPVHSVIANVHSGWRGAADGVTSAAIDSLSASASFDASGAFAYLGPSIRVCCFEVGEEVAERFAARYVDRSHAKPHVDLVSFTADLLREHGFEAERISDSGMCTRCEGSVFHSYRRNGAGAGRNLAVVAQ